MKMPEQEVESIKAIYEVHGQMPMREWSVQVHKARVYTGEQELEILLDGISERIRQAIKTINKRGVIPWVLPARGDGGASDVTWKQPSLFTYEEMERLLTDRYKQIRGDMTEFFALMDLCEARFQQVPQWAADVTSQWRGK